MFPFALPFCYGFFYVFVAFFAIVLGFVFVLAWFCFCFGFDCGISGFGFGLLPGFGFWFGSWSFWLLAFGLVCFLVSEFDCLVVTFASNLVCVFGLIFVLVLCF